MELGEAKVGDDEMVEMVAMVEMILVVLEPQDVFGFDVTVPAVFLTIHP